MSSPSLESKTIRPGSLGTYSYYHSNRRPARPDSPSFITGSRRKLLPKKLLITLVLAGVVIGIPLLRGNNPTNAPVASQTKSHQTPNQTPVAQTPAGTVPAKTVNNCADNTANKLALVSISQRHMWACSGSTTVYDSPVITGITAHASTLTPPGTYHIYGKQTDTVLTGSDETGSWRDPVSYWMPFLNNQYGTYGFHDATWRDNSAFGHVSPDSSDASHGCVELPLTTAAWLYGWAAVGTAVTIES